MVEYLLSILNSTELIALGIKNASESNIFERILEFLSENSLITGITSITVFLLGLLFMIFKKSLLDCCANTFEWLITQVKEAFGEWWEKTKMLLFTLAKETFLILLRRGLYIELERIKVEIKCLHDKLKNADIRADKHDDTISNEEKEKAKKIVGKLVDIIYNFENAYDRYQLLQEMTPETPEYSSNNTWHCWFFVLKKLWELKLNFLILITKITIAFSVAKVNHELENSDSYQPAVTMEEESQQQYQRPPMPPPDYELVGLQSNKKVLIKKLKAGNKRQFIVVTGEAGIGKTTLVEKVYVDSEVTSYFELRAFATVSQTYHQNHILKAIFDQLKAKDEPSVSTSQSATEIVATIRNYLQNSEKSYIIVLDDVWGADDKFSECIRNAFPYNEKGSGILMTMRCHDSNVAAHWTTKLSGITFRVHPLSDADAKRLFCEKVFPSNNGKCINDAIMSLIDNKILKKCENIPLLIGVVAGIFAREGINVSRWETVIVNLGNTIKGDTTYERLKSIFLYSYHDLSYELQQCFLYFGMFPEDSEIYIHTLVHIWVAEGFIKPTGTNHTLEEIAENQLNELIRRGLVILGYKEKLSYHAISLELREKFFRVHDVFHEIILQKIKDLEFCQVLSKASSSEILDKPFHRLSLNNNGGTNLNMDRINTGTFLNWDKSILGNSWVIRSVLSFKNETFPNFPKTSIICLLRVLLLEHYQNYDFPEVVSSLCNLRFLSFTNLRIKKIPVSICKLLNLETLEIKHPSYICQLPKEMSMLKKLRHLLLSYEVQIPEGVLRSLTALQTLEEIAGRREYILKELKHLTQLRRLGIVNVDVKYEEQFSKALQAMPELRFLSTCTWSPVPFWRDTDLYQLEFHPKKLESIELWGILGRYSWLGWIEKVTELRNLSLDLTRIMRCIGNDYKSNELIEELIAVLRPLKKLEYLFLRTQYIYHFDFGSDGFEGLKYLKIRDFHLERITGSLRSLLELDLKVKYNCESMPNLPHHLRKIAVISYAAKADYVIYDCF